IPNEHGPFPCQVALDGRICGRGCLSNQQATDEGTEKASAHGTSSQRWESARSELMCRLTDVSSQEIAAIASNRGRSDGGPCWRFSFGELSAGEVISSQSVW